MDPRLRPADLAPGDHPVADRDWSGLTVHAVASPEAADFVPAYERLWAEFGGRGEMERREVIAARLAWDPHRPVGRTALLYEMLVLRRGDVVAVRDHTAVIRLDDAGQPLVGPTVVHLSHVLVEPAHRGSGLAGWLRALPLETARRCARAIGRAADTPVVLVAEMEPPDARAPERAARLRSYERAGFRMIDPAAAPYAQPDFRSPVALATAPPQAVPLRLLVRRVGREHEHTMPAAEVAAVVESIYAVYGVHVPAAALAPLRLQAAAWTARLPTFSLLAPGT